jgi:ribose transport system substrate-binding protein
MSARHEPRIAVFTKNFTNPAYAAARLAAERVASQMGAQVQHYVPRKPDSADEQIVSIDEALRTRPDAFVFVPVHISAIDDAIARINAAGVPIFNIINKIVRGDYVTFVGADDVALAYAVAERLIARLGGQGDVAIIEGTPGSVTSQARVTGFTRAIERHPNIRMIAQRTGNYQRDDARWATEELLGVFDSVAGVLTANDEMALGAIEAMEAVGRMLPVVGVNALPEAIDALKTGALLATADFNAMHMSAIATEAAIRHLRGERVPREILLPVELVDITNCSRWDVAIDNRGCPRWEDVVR